MAEPTGDPEPPNTQESTTSILSFESFQPITQSSQPARRGKRRRNDSYTTNSNPEPVAAGDGSGRVTNQEIRRLIDDLKNVISHQTNVIEATKAGILELKVEQEALKSQNSSLQEEIHALRAQIEALSSNPPVRTWAEVAASAGNPEPSRAVQQPRSTQARKEPNCVRISTRRAPEDGGDDINSFGRYLPTDSANTYIRSALLSADATKDAQVAGIGTTKTGYVIRFRDQQSADAARSNSDWLDELGNDTKLVKPRFGVVVHRTPTDIFRLPEGEKESIAKIAEDNDLTAKGHRITEIAWLRRRDKVPGTHGSLGIWFDSPEAAEWMVNNGLIVGQRYIGSVEPYQVRRKRCHRCQGFGHLAWSCKEKARSRAGMEALINDTETRNLDVLLVQEPPLTAYKTHVNHSAWRLYQPTIQEENSRKRSLLYVNRRISTSVHRQMKCNHPDVTAVRIWTTATQILLFSVYIPPFGLYQSSEEFSIQPMLDEIQSTIQRTTQSSGKPSVIVLAGDFNRHHPAWSNGPVLHKFVEHAEELVSFFQANRLQWCLPRGAPTYWSLSRPGKTSTIDLTVTDSRERLIKCHLYHDNYGSDHRATYSEWSLRPDRAADAKPRRAYERANWEKIGQAVQEALDPLPEIGSREELEQAVERLVATTTGALDRHVPTAKPSPYSKRWFTPELKAQQGEANRARRRWQESCATRGPHDAQTLTLFTEMREKRRAWTRAIEKAKTTHWKEFLDSAGEGHLWKAASYMGTRESYGSVPSLRVGTEEVSDNEDKARLFMKTFFPEMAEPDEGTITPERERRSHGNPALKATKGTTAPGDDGIPALVWKHLWQYISKVVARIFAASIELGHYPRQWKRARIVVLRKPGKPDYSVPGAYRPISLLNTLGKLLEAVMARRLTYYAETHGLLPDTQFGGRPGRTTEQALLVLANAIDRAWLKMKVVTLVAFDLKGAFNGVNKRSLDARLKTKGIPTKARHWIGSFMEDRQANISFDDFESTVAPLENAGLAQGSPLSPILFTFFNSELVDQPVDYHGGASAYIDDYFRWRAGRSAEENIKKIQEEDIPRIEEWAKRTGSCFAVEKTELIHITRKKSEHEKGQLVMNGSTIQPSPTAKLLGVVFDRELRWKQHVQQAVKRATKVNVALGGLKHLRPAQTRQLYQACVAPAMDYASTVWHNPLKDKTHLRMLETVQRAALIRALSAFRTVATKTLEVEAHVLPTRLRLKQRAQNVVARLYTLPSNHPVQDVLARSRRRSRHVGTGPRLPMAETMKTMDLERLELLETIDPNPPAPWDPPIFETITIESDPVKAMEEADRLRTEAAELIYSDASAQKDKIGAAAVILDRQGNVEVSRKRDKRNRPKTKRTVTILSDSKSGLQTLTNQRNGSGQHIVRAIAKSARDLKAHGVSIRLQWIPSHCNNPGNDTADRLAKEAVGTQPSHPFQNLLSREKAFIRDRVLAEWDSEWKSSSKGAHLRRIDASLPGNHTRHLYGALPRGRAYLLTQLRTGHSWLASHAKAYRFREDDKCECGAKETVVHVLVDCPKLADLRRKLRQEIGTSFNNTSLMLGGGEGGERKKVSGSAQRSTVNAVLDFAEASQRFQSRVQQQG
ncbi:hypothetical protein TESG_08624 [Trichophyton tonsurans CBS 112818]|uniref:Reverse transcriptase n=1 Tax=Trichophyton tonsurans (strain CBS 112818) TaxID=647933 RepID=F2S8R1_TRIT1|nr:hypothetical protein TESG_08624 [Trichophyton tonsurans CBS 112818]